MLLGRHSLRVARVLGIALIVVAVLVALAGQQYRAGANGPVQVPLHHLKHSTSTNWSGYAELTSLTAPQTGSVTTVSGRWVVPALNCAVTPNAYSSSWVGIDGYSSSTVEQLGTEQDCSNGSPFYSAWYEMYPYYPVTIHYTVSPGDTISASVRYIGSNRFTLSMQDGVKWSYSTTQTLYNTARSSAEWIEEAPSSGNSTLPLADFQTVNFSNASATINGATTAINTRAYDPLTMIDGSATATPSAVSGGNAFSVSFSTASSPPPPPPSTATMHVSSITYRYWSWWGALYVTINVRNSSGQAVPNAAIAIALTDTSTSTTYTGSATTNSSGSVTFQLSRPPAGSYTTKVTSLTASGYTWDGVSPANSYYVP